LTHFKLSNIFNKNLIPKKFYGLLQLLRKLMINLFLLFSLMIFLKMIELF